MASDSDLAVHERLRGRGEYPNDTNRTSTAVMPSGPASSSRHSRHRHAFRFMEFLRPLITRRSPSSLKGRQPSTTRPSSVNQWLHAPTLYRCRAVRPCEPLPGVSFNGLPFFRLLVGDMFEILKDAGNAGQYADLPVYVVYGDRLLLAREGSGELGWVLESFVKAEEVVVYVEESSPVSEHQMLAHRLVPAYYIPSIPELDDSIPPASLDLENHHASVPAVRSIASYNTRTHQDSHPRVFTVPGMSTTPSVFENIRDSSTTTSSYDRRISAKTVKSVASYKTRRNQTITPPGAVFLR